MKSAFTLIELIAIVAILAAILFPVFASAKEAAKATVCLSNLKQLNLATVMYTSDSDGVYAYQPRFERRADGTYPFGLTSGGRAKAGTGDPGQPDGYSDAPATNRWDAGPLVELLAPYVKSDGLAFCPVVDRKSPDLSPNTNYEQNAYIFADTRKELTGGGTPGVAISEAVVANPSFTMLFQDTKGTNARLHRGGVNNACADGRAKWLAPNAKTIRPAYWN